MVVAEDDGKLTCRNRTGERKGITFVIGFPQNQAQRDQSRAAIQGNSSRIRWRKGCATAQTAGAVPRQRYSSDSQPPGGVILNCERLAKSSWDSEVTDGDECLEVPPGNALRALGPLDPAILPPFLPLPHQDIMPAAEVWSSLQEGTSADMCISGSDRLTFLESCFSGRASLQRPSSTSVEG